MNAKPGKFKHNNWYLFKNFPVIVQHFEKFQLSAPTEKSQKPQRGVFFENKFFWWGKVDGLIQGVLINGLVW